MVESGGLVVLGTGCAVWTLTEVTRSTQLSTLIRTVKWVSAFRLSNNNKWWWWMWMVSSIYWRTHSPSRSAWSVGHPVLSLHSSNEPGELSQWLWPWWQLRNTSICVIITIITCISVKKILRICFWIVTDNSDWSASSCVQICWIKGSRCAMASFSDDRSSAFLYLCNIRNVNSHTVLYY